LRGTARSGDRRKGWNTPHPPSVPTGRVQETASELVVDEMNDASKVKAQHLKSWHANALELFKKFPNRRCGGAWRSGGTNRRMIGNVVQPVHTRGRVMQMGVHVDNPVTLHAPAGRYSHLSRVGAGELVFVAGQVRFTGRRDVAFRRHGSWNLSRKGWL
jgi:hypothetical protein